MYGTVLKHIGYGLQYIFQEHAMHAIRMHVIILCLYKFARHIRTVINKPIGGNVQSGFVSDSLT